MNSGGRIKPASRLLAIVLVVLPCNSAHTDQEPAQPAELGQPMVEMQGNKEFESRIRFDCGSPPNKTGYITVQTGQVYVSHSSSYCEAKTTSILEKDGQELRFTQSGFYPVPPGRYLHRVEGFWQSQGVLGAYAMSVVSEAHSR